MKHANIDTLFINGTIYTLKEEGHQVEAVGVREGRIVFAGSTEEAGNFEASKVIDLNGKTLIPGMGDSHLHLYAYCQNQTSVRLENVRSMDELIHTMREKAQTVEKGEWIKGTGLDQTKYPENRLPTRWDLDKVSTTHPVVARRTCLHVMVANSLAMKMAGVDKKAIADAEGLIETDETGEPTGVFRERSTILFDDIVPDPLSNPLVKKRVMTAVFDDMVSKGITTIHTYAAKIWNYFEDTSVYRDLEEERLLPIRVTVSLDELFSPEEGQTTGKSPLDKDPFSKVQYGSYKLFTDGSFGSRSAALTEPYSDDPGNCGILTVTKEKLVEDMTKAYSLGLQPAIHAIGDRAMDITLEAIAEVIEKGPQVEGRKPFRIIHAQYVTEEHLEKLKELPVILDIQPIFLCTDLYWIEDRLGLERAKNTYRWKSMLDAGLILAGSSDCPVESYDPIKGIYAAVTRQDLNGYPKGGWRSEEKLSVFDALCLFTKNIAYTTGEEDVLGTIEVNKFADLVLLDRDPFLVSSDELKDIKVIKTFVAGKKVFESKSLK